MALPATAAPCTSSAPVLGCPGDRFTLL